MAAQAFCFIWFVLLHYSDDFFVFLLKPSIFMCGPAEGGKIAFILI